MTKPTIQKVSMAAVAIAIAVIVFFGVKAVNAYFDNRGVVETLTIQVASKDTEIGTLRENLNKTEEGKRQVEAAKNASDRNVATQSNRANSAEADANATRGQLTSVNSQLSSTTAELSSANSDLASVNRCISTFNGLRPSIARYQQSQIDENRYSNLASGVYLTDYSLYTYYIGLSNEQTRIANSLWPTINSTLSMITTGNC